MIHRDDMVLERRITHCLYAKWVGAKMLFMVVETFRNQDAKSAYRRFRDKGRMMPEGLSFVGSWTTADSAAAFSSWRPTT